VQELSIALGQNAEEIEEHIRTIFSW